MIPKPDFQSLRPVRVLLLEDDPDCVALVRRALQAVRWAELSLDAVGTLALALERLGEAPYDMVIVDLNVPDSRGLQTLRAVVRATDRLVIVLTAMEEPGLREQAIAGGAYDFMHKGQLGEVSLGSLVRLAALHADSLRRMRERESRLSAIVNAEPECVKLVDGEGRLIEMNPAGIRMIEAKDVEQVRGHCMFDLVAAEHRQAFRALTQRVAAGTEDSLEFEMVGLQGTRRWLETRAVPLLDEATGETLVLGITRDITERKRAAEALKESEERFRGLVMLSSDWYWEQDERFRYTRFEGRVSEMLGVDPAPMLGKCRWEVAGNQPVSCSWEEHEALLRAHRPFRNFESCRMGDDGELHYVSASGEPIFDAQGAFRGYRGVAAEITERKRAEQALRESEARFRSLTELSSDWYWEQDAELRFVGTGGAKDERGGISPAVHIGKRRWDLPGTDIVNQTWEEHKAVLAARKPFRDLLLRRTGSDGQDHYVSVAGEPIFDAARRFCGYRGVARDVTARMRAEQALRESEGRFRSLTQLSSDMYWEQDAEYRFTKLSGRTPPGLEAARAGMLGMRRWEVDHFNMSPSDWAQHKADVGNRRVFRDLELGRLNHNGEQVWISVSGEPVFDDNGAFKGYRGIGTDITSRKREERLLALEHAVTRRLAEARSVSEALKAVMQALCESENWESARYFSLDEAAELMRFSDGWHVGHGALAEFTERSRGRRFARGEGLVGHAWQSGEALWIPDVQSDPRSTRSALVEKAGVHSALLLPIWIGSRVVGILSMSSATIRQPDDRLLGTLRMIGSQIGQFLQRIEAQAALSESESRFRQTYELAASGIAHIGIDGRFLRVNRKVCEILGYPEEALIGRSVKEISHPEDRDVTDAERARVHGGEVESARFEKRYIRSDGRVVWVGLTVALARNGQGVPQYEISIMEDISERKATESALMRFRTALDSSADMFFLVDMSNGRLVDFNDTACSNLGYERSELLGRSANEILVVPSLADLLQSYGELLASGPRADSLNRIYRRKDGSTFEAEVLRRAVDSADGPIMVVNSRDLTERRQAEARQATHLRYQEKIARFGESALTKREASELVEEAVRTVLEALGGGAVAYVERGSAPREVVLRALVGLPDAAGDLTARYEASAALARALDACEPISVEATRAQPALPFLWAQDHASALLIPVLGDSGARGALCVLSDLPGAFGVEESRFVMASATVLSAALQRTDSEGRLAFLAQFDGLTGLPNRALLSDRFSQMIVQARRHGTSLGVLFIDLDDFKLVNDSLGHPAGDELLKETARRLMASIRTGDTVARIAGDEFAIILADLARADDAALVAQKVIERIAAPVEVRGQEVFVTASVGVATFPADGDDAESLLGAADAAMYRAKQSGRNAYQFFTSEINQRTRARAQLGTELRRALERGEFMLVYQPKFDLQRAEACGAEALLRWKHPERGVVSPAEFIPVLEESGLIVPVGEWVLRQACADLEDWKASGLAPMPVAVNLSARQFRQQDLDARIRALIAEAGVDPALIELEITESQLMQDPDHAIRVMESLSSAGIRIAIDDFGTGYSSLSYLTRFPVSSLKIDRSFVADVLTDEADGAIVRAIIDMAHTLGFTVVAEGVETEAQAAFLQGLSCEQAQGYLFARPMPTADFKALISSARTKGSRKGRAAARYQ
jgi:diguanylate cyclase (GGDEF)-like protein/PAS domain S-box-containing protein